MTKQLAGVALAAAMACGCLGASAERAEAITLSASILGGIGPYGDGGSIYSINILNNVVSASISQREDEGCIYSQFPNQCNYAGYDIETSINGSIGIRTEDARDHGGPIVYYLSILDKNAVQSTYDIDGSYNLHLVSQQTVEIETAIQFYFYDTNGVKSFSDFLIDGKAPDSVSLDLSSVPLPATAPLFGAALLGLGGFGYGMKRRSRSRMA